MKLSLKTGIVDTTSHLSQKPFYYAKGFWLNDFNTTMENSTAKKNASEFTTVYEVIKSKAVFSTSFYKLMENEGIERMLLAWYLRQQIKNQIPD